MLYKIVLISDVLDHIGRIYSPSNLGNMFLNTTPDNQRFLNSMLFGVGPPSMFKKGPIESPVNASFFVRDDLML